MKTKDLRKLVKYLEEIEKTGCPIQIEVEIINTGLILKPKSCLDYKEWIDLGGRHISINIEIPNKSITTKLKEFNE